MDRLEHVEPGATSYTGSCQGVGLRDAWTVKGEGPGPEVSCHGEGLPNLARGELGVYLKENDVKVVRHIGIKRMATPGSGVDQE
jgi:hypothetical protein